MGLFDSSSTTTSNYYDQRVAAQTSGATSPVRITDTKGNQNVSGDNSTWQNGNGSGSGNARVAYGTGNTIIDQSGDVAIKALSRAADTADGAIVTMDKLAESAITANTAASGTIASTVLSLERLQTTELAATQHAIADQAAQQSADKTSAMTTLLSAVTDLGKTTATGGQSDMNKTFLYIALAGFAALSAVAYFFFKK